MDQRLAQFIYYIAARARAEQTFRYLDDYQKSQFWTTAQWADYQRDKLASLLSYAQNSIPFYRSQNNWELADFPIITKTQLQEQQTLFCPVQLGQVTRKTTGGSTGQPVTILKDKEAMAREQAATLRCYRWAGILPGDRQARFWGTTGTLSGGLQQRIRDFSLNRIRFSAFNFNEHDFQQFMARLIKFSPAYLYGYASMLDRLAVYLNDTKTRPNLPQLKALISTSEVLSPEVRENLSNTFGVRVFNEYGCGEVGSIAHECEYGALHIVAENVLVEILNEQNQPLKDSPGRVVITELHNHALPLIRYELGDYATLSTEACPCGRTLPILKSVQGRAYDIIIGPNGKNYHPEFFIYIFENVKRRSSAIRQFQVVQDDRHLRINIVLGENSNVSLEKAITAALNKEFGDYFSYEFCYCDEIAREASGKMRVVKRLQPE